MAHLVKLEDYVSRYEVDIQQYPSQYTRLKRERWQQLQRAWAEANQGVGAEYPDDEDWFADVQQSFWQYALQKVSGIYKRQPNDEKSDHDDKNHHLVGKSRESLLAFFYYEWMQSQLKWASSSSSEESVLDSKYRYDSRLREFLRLLPDNYMVFYYPVFRIQQADVQLDVLLLSPSEIYCVTYVETPPHTLFEGGSNRFWREFRSKKEYKRLNPLLAVKRMEDVVQSIFQANGIYFPVQKVVLLPAAIVDDTELAHNVTIVDHRGYDQWMNNIGRHASPMKKIQFQAAECLLGQGKTRAYSKGHMVETSEEQSR
ncbi:nuclease-related domain-containing protein [Natribacillus halophilus]|uniref:Nuclease-related domain-containing protein n=1 Tax=Natribacillus halophilus TaxID=549003 RepID=A0A1G8NG61_9BACI|nr:nuclease-related domain-containing protein [Natribacillus halophilus]SDI79261.1 Nuclease-related domain-containing protein [Natribacillus halophilus]